MQSENVSVDTIGPVPIATETPPACDSLCPRRLRASDRFCRKELHEYATCMEANGGGASAAVAAASGGRARAAAACAAAKERFDVCTEDF